MISQQQYLVIIATSVISAALGSIHAFSVFIAQWESLLGVNRANVSLIYSLALVTLTPVSYTHLTLPTIYSV